MHLCVHPSNLPFCSSDGMRRATVLASSSRTPYFRVCASDDSGLKVSAKGATINVSVGSPFKDPVVSSRNRVTYQGPLDGNVYVRIIRGKKEKKVVVKAEF